MARYLSFGRGCKPRPAISAWYMGTFTGTFNASPKSVIINFFYIRAVICAFFDIEF